MNKTIYTCSDGHKLTEYTVDYIKKYCKCSYQYCTKNIVKISDGYSVLVSPNGKILHVTP